MKNPLTLLAKSYFGRAHSPPPPSSPSNSNHPNESNDTHVSLGVTSEGEERSFSSNLPHFTTTTTTTTTTTPTRTTATSTLMEPQSFPTHPHPPSLHHPPHLQPEDPPTSLNPMSTPSPHFHPTHPFHRLLAGPSSWIKSPPTPPPLPPPPSTPWRPSSTTSPSPLRRSPVPSVPLSSLASSSSSSPSTHKRASLPLPSTTPLSTSSPPLLARKSKFSFASTYLFPPSSSSSSPPYITHGVLPFTSSSSSSSSSSSPSPALPLALNFTRVFPLELVHRILGYLDVTSLVRFQQCSRVCWRLGHQDEVWHGVYVHASPWSSTGMWVKKWEEEEEEEGEGRGGDRPDAIQWKVGGVGKLGRPGSFRAKPYVASASALRRSRSQSQSRSRSPSRSPSQGPSFPSWQWLYKNRFRLLQNWSNPAFPPPASSHIHTLHGHTDSVYCLQVIPPFSSHHAARGQEVFFGSTGGGQRDPPHGHSTTLLKKRKHKKKQKTFVEGVEGGEPAGGARVRRHPTSSEGTESSAFGSDDDNHEDEEEDDDDDDDDDDGEPRTSFPYLLSGSRDHTVHVWEIRSPPPPPSPSSSSSSSTSTSVTSLFPLVHRLVGHTGSVLCLHAQPPVLVTGSSDTTLMVWDLTKWQRQQVLVGHTAGVLDVVLSKTLLISCSKDTTIKLWDGTYMDDDEPVTVEENDPDHDEATTRRNAPEDHEEDRRLRALIAHRALLLNTGRSRPKKRHPVPYFQVRCTLTGHRAAVNAIQYVHGILVSASGDYSLKIWHIDPRPNGLAYCVRELQGHTRGIACVAFDGLHVFSGSNDRTIKVWDVHTGQCLKTLHGHDDLVRTLALDPLGVPGKLISGSYDQSVKVWDWTCGTLVHSFTKVHSSWVFNVACTATHLFSASQDQTIVVYDFTHGVDPQWII